jgi:hypothetical protein
MKLKKEIQLKKEKPESTYLTYKTCDSGHEIMITSYKENKKMIIKLNSQST